MTGDEQAKRQQEPPGRPRYRHVEDRRNGGGDQTGRRLRRDRLRQPSVARVEEGRRGQYRIDRQRDSARARGSRADGRLQDPRGVHRHRRQPHQELQLAWHGRDQGSRGGPDRRRPRDRNRQGRQHPDRPADPAHPQPGIHHRRPGGCARAARHERRASGGEGAHRHRRGVGGAEHHEVRAPLRPRSRGSDPAAARLGNGRAVGGREGSRRVPRRHRRRNDRYRGLHPGRDPPYLGHSDRGRSDHQRHRDGAAPARCASSPTPTRWWRCRVWAIAPHASFHARRWRK
jgi:hypothetical protein